MSTARGARPEVIANFAITFDGKTAPPGGGPSLFSSKRDKRRLVEIRALGDALLVGASTLAADTMTMGIPDAALRRRRARQGLAEYPLRVIFSSSGRIDPGWRVFQHHFSPIVVMTTRAMPAETRARLGEMGVEVVSQSGREVDVAAALEWLAARRGVRKAVCEGGPRLIRAFFEADCVDELYITWCPAVFGGRDTPRLCGAGRGMFPRAVRLRLVSWRAVAGECFLRYAVLRGPALCGSGAAA